jgi:type I restriction enzyme S subunit
LKSGRIRRQLVDGGNGANIKSLNQGTLSAITVPVPAVSVQHGVIERVSRLVEERDRIDALYQRKLAALDELKQSLLRQAFSGQL